ncbi:Uncharacterized membrane protein [Pseudomonas flavescens]|uniref:Uncharacterized membrane protein n=1 Tax=Phytopseudomonas flavescens TaxID=29435 RepID=A0A1G8KRT5_9GAMM|nr:CopD family protein [Pseudomonas flavescens]SDI46181.1 Uncharacterized membrane protein [Pseudomonas flavescens]
MQPYSLVYSLHLLVALIWVGGLFFAWVVLRPASAATLQPAERLTLWLDVFRRFFVWVWVAVLVLPISGVGMLHMGFSGFDGAPRYVHVMTGVYLAMLALFLRIQALQVPALRRAVDAQDWPAGGAVLSHIRRLVAINLSLGLAVVAIAAVRPSL